MKKIFVFGSNLAGFHGAGSAAHAFKNHGARHGCGIGLRGSSYAIPTKDKDLQVLPLARIYSYVENFLDFAREHPEMEFDIVAIGCGLAGYNPAQIAPMFKSAPKNCKLPPAFSEALAA